MNLPLPQPQELAYAAREALDAVLLSYASTLPPTLIEIGKLALSGPGKLLSLPDAPPEGMQVGLPRWPAYVLLAYLASVQPEARSAWRAALPAAVAVEISMAAADLIDEITDDDPSAVAGRYGTGQALNTANLMLVIAQQTLARVASAPGEGAVNMLPALEALQAMLVQAAVGQHLDMLHSGSGVLNVSLELSAHITSLKAAALIAGACRIGALASGAPPDVVDLVARFGSETGMIAQIANDTEAVLPPGDEPDPAGEAPHDKTDLRLRRPTLPVVFTLRDEEGEPNALQRAYALPPAGSTAPEGEAELRRAVLQTGGLQFARLLIEVHTQNARDALDALEAMRPGSRAILSPLLPHPL